MLPDDMTRTGTDLGGSGQPKLGLSTWMIPFPHLDYIDLFVIRFDAIFYRRTAILAYCCERYGLKVSKACQQIDFVLDSGRWVESRRCRSPRLTRDQTCQLRAGDPADVVHSGDIEILTFSARSVLDLDEDYNRKFSTLYLVRMEPRMLTYRARINSCSWLLQGLIVN